MKKFILLFCFVFPVKIYSQSFILEWIKSFGGSNFEYIRDITIDNNGNIYLTGVFKDTVDFDPGPFVAPLYSSGNFLDDIFVVKLSQFGNFYWAKKIGGFDDDQCFDIKLDNSGNIYIVGYFNGTTDFDPGPANFNLTAVGGSKDIFILKLNSNGDFVWVKQLGENGMDNARSFMIDSNNNLIISGWFTGYVDFNPDSTTNYLLSNGGEDIFIMKMNENGEFQWVKKIGSGGNDNIMDLTLDIYNNIIITGNFEYNMDFDPGSGVFMMAPVGLEDIYILKLDSVGNFIWSRQMGGTGTDGGFSVTTDSLLNIYSCGVFENSVDFNPGTGILQLFSNGQEDIYIQKLTTNGNLVWAKSIGGSQGDYVGTITCVNSNAVLVTGNFLGNVDFDPNSPTSYMTATGANDAFILNISTDGNFLGKEKIGSVNLEFGVSIGKNNNGDVYVSGMFSNNITLNTQPGFSTISSNGNTDIFITKLFDCTYIPTSITQSGSFLTSDAIINSYQWLDCNNSNMPIVGATNQSYQAPVNGSYAVTLNDNGCSLTSDCYSVSSVNIAETKFTESVVIFQNHSTDFIILKFSSSDECLLNVININGQIVMCYKLTHPSEFILDIRPLNVGIYFLKVNQKDTEKYFKFLKE